MNSIVTVICENMQQMISIEISIGMSIEKNWNENFLIQHLNTVRFHEGIFVPQCYKYYFKFHKRPTREIKYQWTYVYTYIEIYN